jgi:general secretion pathway protein G
MKKIDRRRAGFSFIEIIVVMVIIAILAGVVTVNVLHKPTEAKISAAKMQLQQLRTAVEMYSAEQGHVPTQEQGLQALVRKTSLPPVPERFPPNGYLSSAAVPLDPWKHPYVYVVPGRSNEVFEIISYGSDGEPGGVADAADISSSNLQ